MVLTRAQRKAQMDEGAEQEDNGQDICLTSRTNHLCDLIFGNDLSRETIVDYVVHDNEGRLSLQDALSCRLVQKSWLESVFKSLVKSGNWLVKLQMANYLQDRLEPFVKLYKPWSRLPFKLEVTLYAGRYQWTLKLLADCFHLCGGGLVELKLKLNVDKAFLQRKEKRPMDFTWQKSFFTLPALQKLTYSILNLPGVSKNTDVGNDDIEIGSLPRTFFSRCLRLKCFNFVAGLSHNEPLPVTLGNLLLPGTIANLVLDCKIISNYLERLMKFNMFPKLTDLTVVLPGALDQENDGIYALLDRVRYTLKTLNILHGVTKRPAVTTKIDPPLMRCLETIVIQTSSFEWFDGITNLHKKLPEIKKIDVNYVTLTSLKKWMTNTKFASLTQVSITFFDFLSVGTTNFLTLEAAQLMYEACPNVTNLKICTSFAGYVNQALQCLFENMTQVQVLTLILQENGTENLHLRYLDALLLGIPCELIDTLKSTCSRGKLWEAVQGRMNKKLSLSNLSELREIRLVLGCRNETFVVSEKVKEFLVSTMPNLIKIDFTPTYMFTPTAVQRWIQTERIYNWE